MLVSTKPIESIQTFHQRTHLSYSHILSLSKQGLIDGLNLTKNIQHQNFDICISCAMAKMKRRPFIKIIKSNTPTRPFEQVDSDVEEINPTGIRGERYIISFICTLTKYKFIYTMLHKNEAPMKLKLFILELKNINNGLNQQLNLNINRILTDGGLEYKADFDKLCTDFLFLHYTTSPHMPETNGTSENYWRTLIGTTRAFLIHSNLSHKLWPFAATHANHVLNRTLTVTINGKTSTPYELIYNKKPNLNYLRTWGCEIFHYNTDVARTKLEPKGLKGFFMGFSPDKLKCFIIFQPPNKISNTGSILFNEIIKPPTNVNNGEALFNLKTPLELLSEPNNNNKKEKTTKRKRSHIDENNIIPKRTRSNNINENNNINLIYLLTSATDTDENLTFKEVMARTDKEQWKAAINNEIQSFENLNVWHPV